MTEYSENEVVNKKIHELVARIDKNDWSSPFLWRTDDTINEPINDYCEGDSLFAVYLWSGRGYVLDNFLVFGVALEQVLDILGDYLLNKGYTDYILNIQREIEEIMEDEGIDYEEAEDKFYEWGIGIPFGDCEYALREESFEYSEYEI